jgi:hypothetical protein
MANLNRPDRAIINSHDDQIIPTSANNGFYNRIVNNLQTPLLNVKAIQLTRANFINSSLPLNDVNGQLFFCYARTASASAAITSANIQIVRLHPSWFVPAASFTAFVKNKYYTSVAELVTDLNLAASTGGDNVTYNARWLVNDVTFAYNTATRRITFTGNTATFFYSPVPSDFPGLNAILSAITMNALGGVKTQPFFSPTAYSVTPTMNARLGFAMSYTNRGVFWGANSVVGCATSTGVPQANTVGTEGDSWPILLGVQNVQVYLNAANGSGIDAQNRKALLASIPVEAPPLGVNSYTTTSLQYPALSVANEIYSLELTLLDEEGNPYLCPQNYNSYFELSILY